MENGPQDVCLRFVFVSDLHNVTFGQGNRVLLSAIRDQKPDAVLIGGDTLVGKPGVSMEKAIDFVRGVSAEFPVFYANGNHEQRLRLYPGTYGDMYERFRREIRDAGAEHLVNRTVRREFSGVPVAIHGFEADRKYYNRFEHTSMPSGELNAVFGKPDTDSYHILLAHNPAYKETYLAWGADLTLCGHYHGGLMRFGEHHGLVSPDLKLFSGLCHGMFRQGERRMIVSSGLGEHTIPFRVHDPRELVVLEVAIKSKEGLRHGNSCETAGL